MGIPIPKVDSFSYLGERRYLAHMGQERTWGYCREKYYKIFQALVRQVDSFSYLGKRRYLAHMGQEWTWGYCREKYYKIFQALVRHYYETWSACMKSNLVTQLAKGSRKPIQSRASIKVV
jgi:hypothetical protein